MIQQLFFGTWIAAVTLAGIYFGQGFSMSSGDVVTVDGVAVKTGVFKTNLVAFPYINETGLVGYVMTRFTLRTNEDMAKTSPIPVDLVIYDTLNSHFFAEAGKLSTPQGWGDLQSSLDGMRDRANKLAGGNLIVDVLIEQLDFFDKDQVRVPAEVRFDE
jgi:hypothetical protein